MSMILENFNSRSLVIGWLFGFVGAGLALSVDQKRTADRSCWGWSPWQNEIAIWNLGAIVMIIGVLLTKKDVEPALLPGLFILSLAFCINHVVAIIRHPERRYPTNIAAAVANGVGVIAFVLHFVLQQVIGSPAVQ
jgi:hypothetical protein